IDPVATMNSIQMSISGAIDSPGESEYRNSIVPIVQWDIISGWRSRNSAGKDAIEYAQKLESLDLDMTINPTKSLELSLLLPENTIFFFINPRFYMDRPDFIQAISNVREEFKSEGKILVFIGSHFSMPPELQHD